MGSNSSAMFGYLRKVLTEIVEIKKTSTNINIVERLLRCLKGARARLKSRRYSKLRFIIVCVRAITSNVGDEKKRKKGNYRCILAVPMKTLEL